MKHKHKIAYMRTARVWADCSVSNRLSVGAVLVKNNRIISCGYNALPECIDGALEDSEGHTKPETRHAEMNALFALVRSTENAVDSTLFCTHACCKQCAILIVDSGVKEFYYSDMYRCDEGLKYLEENGITVNQLTVK